MSGQRIADGKKQITVIFDLDLLQTIDEAAKRDHMTRTTWLTQAALGHLPLDLGSALQDARMSRAA